MVRIAAFLCLAAALTFAQDHQAIMNEHGDHVMGFSHDKTTHHFELNYDGGLIDVRSNDVRDIESRNQIRSHFRHIAQMFAEELDCDWSKVSTEYPTPGQNLARGRVWGDFFTAGSRGIRTSHEILRKGGATARMMLIQAAANQWKVPAAECVAEKGVIKHKGSDRSVTFGQVAEAASKIEPPKDVPLKSPSEFTLVGAVTHGPAVRPLDTFATTVADGTLTISV